VDLIVEFEDVDPLVRGGAYLDLMYALDELLGLEVDLVSAKPPGEGNPYFWKSANRSRQPVYERARHEAPV